MAINIKTSDQYQGLYEIAGDPQNSGLSTGSGGSGATITSVDDFGAVGDGTTNDTAAIQAAIDYVNSLVTGTTTTTNGNAINKLKGQVHLVPGKEYLIDTITIPPGIVFEMNNSTLLAASASTMVYVKGSRVGYYAGQKVGIRNGIIDGNDIATKGIFIDIVNWSSYSDITVIRCVKAWTLHEVQYSTFTNCYGYDSTIGWYITSRPDGTSLTSIDNSFYNCGATRNEKYGVWIQNSSFSTFNRLDASRNKTVDVLIGSALVDYISGYTVTNGGSGYTPDSQLPLIITDSTGSQATGYAVTNSSGVIIAAYTGECGKNYTNPSISVSGGSSAVITATISDDSSLGDWVGTTSTTRVNLTFHELKVEHNKDDIPKSGYAVWVNDLGHRNVNFYNLSVTRQSSGSLTENNYTKWLRSDTYGVSVIDPIDAELISPLNNPSVTDDIGIFMSSVSNGLFIKYGYPAPSFANMPKLATDELHARNYGSKVLAFGIDGNGLLIQGSTSIGFNLTDIIYRARSTDDANDRIRILASGDIQFGDGNTTPDTNIKRASANLIQADDQIYCVDGLRNKVKAGTISDTDFTVVGSGLMAVDTTNNKLWIRFGTTWLSAQFT